MQNIYSHTDEFWVPITQAQEDAHARALALLETLYINRMSSQQAAQLCSDEEDTEADWQELPITERPRSGPGYKTLKHTNRDSCNRWHVHTPWDKSQSLQVPFDDQGNPAVTTQAELVERQLLLEADSHHWNKYRQAAKRHLDKGFQKLNTRARKQHRQQHPEMALDASRRQSAARKVRRQADPIWAAQERHKARMRQKAARARKRAQATVTLSDS